MDEQAIKNAIASLDDGVPKDGARVSIRQYGGGPDESQIVANRLGYLRLGIEMLKAAFPPAHSTDEPKSNMVYPDLEYLMTKDSTINFDWCELREPDSDGSREASKFGWLIPAIFFTVVASILVLALVGLVTVVRWIAV